MSDIRKHQIDRVLIKEKRKRKARAKLVIGGLTAAIALTVAYFSAFDRDRAMADTASPISTAATSQVVDTRYSDKPLSYKKVNADANAYERIESSARIDYKIRVNEYVEYFGQEDSWAKIRKNGKIAYVQSEKLTSLDDKELKIVRGQLMDGKSVNYPDDFNPAFSPEAENAMMVMLEAMNREGLKIDVVRKTIKPDELITEKDSEELYGYPEYSHHTLRSGLAIQVALLGEEESNNLEQSLEGKWLRDNAHKYGFVLRYPKNSENKTGYKGDPSIYRYVGLEVAQDMHKNKMTLEEYFGL